MYYAFEVFTPTDLQYVRFESEGERDQWVGQSPKRYATPAKSRQVSRLLKRVVGWELADGILYAIEPKGGTT